MGLIKEYCEMPGCSNAVIQPHGRESSRILILRDSPSYDEIKSGRGFSDPVSDIVREELRRVGIDADHAYNMYFIPHSLPPNNKQGKLELAEHNEWSFSQLMGKILSNSFSSILIVGSNNCRFLTERNAQDICGLNIIDEKHGFFTIIPESIKLMVATGSASALRKQPLGEFRLAIEKFAGYYKELK